jgi:hypothetical protein
MAGILMAVVVAFLADGSINYASEPAHTVDDCKAHVAQIITERLEANKKEDVKVKGFSYRCDEFPSDMFDFDIPPAPAPTSTPKPKLFPGDTSA